MSILVGENRFCMIEIRYLTNKRKFCLAVSVRLSETPLGTPLLYIDIPYLFWNQDDPRIENLPFNFLAILRSQVVSLPLQSVIRRLHVWRLQTFVCSNGHHDRSRCFRAKGPISRRAIFNWEQEGEAQVQAS